MRLLLLRELALPRELDVVLVKYYFLDIVCRHLSHEQRLYIAILVALCDLILEAKELEYLLEHRWGDRSFLRLALWHLGRSLLGVDLDRLLSIPELVQLAEDLGGFSLELLL